MQSRTAVRRTALAACAAAAALVLSACGGGEKEASSAHEGHGKNSAEAQKDGHNKADTAFASGMVPHHRQAVEMSGLAPSRAGSQKVKDLAEEIEDAQGPEIKEMSGWLKQWGEKVPGSGNEGHGDGGHSGHGTGHGEGHEGMTGMMTAEQMAGLKDSSGKKFDDMFLRMMVEHHEGAVEMARTEQKDGAHKPAKELAGEIIGAQKKEITQMKDLLGGN